MKQKTTSTEEARLTCTKDEALWEATSGQCKRCFKECKQAEVKTENKTWLLSKISNNLDLYSAPYVLAE